MKTEIFFFVHRLFLAFIHLGAINSVALLFPTRIPRNIYLSVQFSPCLLLSLELQPPAQQMGTRVPSGPALPLSTHNRVVLSSNVRRSPSHPRLKPFSQSCSYIHAASTPRRPRPRALCPLPSVPRTMSSSHHTGPPSLPQTCPALSCPSLQLRQPPCPFHLTDSHSQTSNHKWCFLQEAFPDCSPVDRWLSATVL